MPLPTLTSQGHLPQGRHPATLGEIHDLFVVKAPHQDRRALIFQALSVWAQQMKALVPTGVIWIDGGFVTHKTWPPLDVDVVVRCTTTDLSSLTNAQQVEFNSLLTEKGADGRRIQPMGGLVDGFLSIRSNPDQTLYWDKTWSAVTDQSKNLVAGLNKGYVEVKLNGI